MKIDVFKKSLFLDNWFFDFFLSFNDFFFLCFDDFLSNNFFNLFFISSDFFNFSNIFLLNLFNLCNIFNFFNFFYLFLDILLYDYIICVRGTIKFKLSSILRFHNNIITIIIFTKFFA